MGNSQMGCCEGPNIGQQKLQVIVPMKDQIDVQHKELNVPYLNEAVRKSLQKHNPFAQKVNKQAKLYHYGKDIYQGELGQHGQPQGYGRMFYPNGSIFIGQFKKGVAQGDGHFIWPDGSYYHGKMFNNQANDIQGVYVSTTFKYKGGIKNNHFQGYGAQEQDGSMFEGQFIQGKPKKGKLIWVERQIKKVALDSSQLKNETQWIFYGQFDENGNFTGKGRLVNIKGIFEGEFLNGKKNGKGIFTYQNGLRYEGEYKNDVRNGTGIIHNAQNKVSYCGQFKDGMPHGKGWVPLPDGTPNHLQFNQGISSIIINQKEQGNHKTE